MRPGLRVSGLYRYPVKSMAGEALKEATLDDLGLQGDRRYMLVDEAGRFLSQREIPRMATVHARLLGDELLLEYESSRLLVRPDDFSPHTIHCQIWKDTVPAQPARPSINETLSQWLDTPVRLVKLANSACRQVDRSYVPPGVQTGFTDGFPLLVVSQASLDYLSRLCGRALDTRHFRPNLVITGGDAYAEDQWREIRIGTVRLHLVKACSRCAITTVDPDSGRFAGPEPLATLARYRRRGNKVFFGQNAWASAPAKENPDCHAPVLRLNQAVTVEKIRGL